MKKLRWIYWILTGKMVFLHALVHVQVKEGEAILECSLVDQEKGHMMALGITPVLRRGESMYLGPLGVATILKEHQ